MKKVKHLHTPQAVNEEHGTTKSYIVGFVLSLLFTIIPYHLVVNEGFKGSIVLATILVFAVIQMLIQIFFFLHLGRGPKPLYNIFFFFATALTIVFVVAASVFIMNNLYKNMSPTEAIKRAAEKEAIYQLDGQKTGACQHRGANHKVTIINGSVGPMHIDARLCDTITFVNEDDQPREIAFGAHPAHDSYGGQTEVPLRKGRNKSITLNQLGYYLYHDHLDPVANGSFRVTD